MQTPFMHIQRSVQILLFDDVEVLDFAGPFEVFAVAGGRDGTEPFTVSTVSPRSGAVRVRGGLSINPTYTFADCPPGDILLVPGGFGTRAIINDPVVIDWVRTRAETAELVLSVCSGALVLGSAGLLGGLRATTHCSAINELRSVAPTAEVCSVARVVDNGHIVLSAGVSAGIDLALYIVRRLYGREMACETARYIEYDWREGASNFAGESL